jgi:hypothetical protein
VSWMPSQLADIYDKDASSDCRFKDGRYRLITTSFDRIFRGSAGPDIARPEGRVVLRRRKPAGHWLRRLRCLGPNRGEIDATLHGELDNDPQLAELRAAGRHRSARQLPTYAKRTRKQLIAGVQKRRAERTKPAGLSE